MLKNKRKGGHCNYYKATIDDYKTIIEKTIEFKS